MTRSVVYSLLLVCLCSTPAWAKNAPRAPGIAVDAQGGAVIDPTRNVLDLVEKETRRQDDLRISFEKYVDAELRHVKDMADLRAENDRLLRSIDMERQQKVREVDVLGARTETDRAQAAIKALAETSNSTAETLRKTVETTAIAAAAQQDMRFAETNKRVQGIESQLSEGKGAKTQTDPQLVDMVAELKSLRSLQTQGSGKDEGMDKLFSWIMAIISALGGAGIGVYFGKKKESNVAAPHEKLVREVP